MEIYEYQILFDQNLITSGHVFWKVENFCSTWWLFAKS